MDSNTFSHLSCVCRHGCNAIVTENEGQGLSSVCQNDRDKSVTVKREEA